MSKDKRKHRFTITTAEGESVKVICTWDMFTGGSHHLEFRGAISITCYWSHFFWGAEESGGIDIYATEVANEKEKEMRDRENKALRCKRMVGGFSLGENVQIDQSNSIITDYDLDGCEGTVVGYDYPYNIAVRISDRKWVGLLYPEALTRVKATTGQLALF